MKVRAKVRARNAELDLHFHNKCNNIWVEAEDSTAAMAPLCHKCIDKTR